MVNNKVKNSIVRIILHSIILISEIDKVENVDSFWLHMIKKTGNSFIKQLIKYVDRHKILYSDDTSSNLYEALDVIKDFSKNLSIENIQKFNDYINDTK